MRPDHPPISRKVKRSTILWLWMDDLLINPVKMRISMKKRDQSLPTTATHDVAVDRSVLAVISNGKATIERKLITLFRRLNNEDVEMLLKAIADGDMAVAVHASHRISGAARMIGATGLAVVAEQIETASRANNLHAIEVNRFAFQQEVERVYAFFDSIQFDRPNDEKTG